MSAPASVTAASTSPPSSDLFAPVLLSPSAVDPRTADGAESSAVHSEADANAAGPTPSDLQLLQRLAIAIGPDITTASLDTERDHSDDGATTPDLLSRASDCGSAGSAALSPSDPPVARLYRHALESIFAFLDVCELHSAVAVCYDWSGAVGSMPAVNGTLRSWPQCAESMREWRLVRHVRQMLHCSLMELNRADLLLIVDCMPQLRNLSWSLVGPLHGPVQFPARLQRAELQLPETCAADINSLLEALGRLTQLQALHLFVPRQEMIDGARFELLAPAAALRVLQLWHAWFRNQPVPVLLSNAQFGALRGLTQLEELNVDMAARCLRRLVQWPLDEPLRWRTAPQLNLTYASDDATGPALAAAVPGLTSLNVLTSADYGYQPDLMFLHSLANLAELSLSGMSLFGEVAVRGLSGCTQLTSLSLQDVDIGHSGLCAALSLMPLLSSLDLARLRRLESLDFLSAGRLTQTLTHLHLCACQTPSRPPFAWAPLRPLQYLQSLHLRHTPMEAMDEATLSLHRQHLPALTDFIFEPPVTIGVCG